MLKKFMEFNHLTTCHTNVSNCPRYHKKRAIQVGHCNWHGMAFIVIFLKFIFFVILKLLEMMVGVMLAAVPVLAVHLFIEIPFTCVGAIVIDAGKKTKLKT
jgi:hypothetical protein